MMKLRNMQLTSLSNKKIEIGLHILWLGTVMAALKMIFFDYTFDEEYQIMMSYRMLRGDHMFKEMWEPHQMSAFLCTGLMWIYKAVLGTYTGVIVYLRVCTTIIQIGISLYLYKILCRLTLKEYALLCGLIYFNIVPKNLEIPEFANMQLWFFTLTVLLLMQYYMDAERYKIKKIYLLILAGICMALEVLSYPSCIVLFLVFVVCIWKQSEKNKWRDVSIFAGVCIGCAVVWLIIVLQGVSFKEFVENIVRISDFDLTHEASGATADKGHEILKNIFGGIAFLTVSFLFSYLVVWILKKRKKIWDREQIFLMLLVNSVLVAECIQMFLWTVKKSGYEVYQVHLFLLLFCGILAWRLADEKKQWLFWGLIGTGISYLAVIYLSNLELYNALPHGVLGVVFAALVLVFALQKVMGEAARYWIYVLLISVCAVCVWGKGYTLRAGRDYNTVIDTESIMKHGPAVGILSDYMNAYIYNCNYQDFAQYVSAEDTVLIVANTVFSESTTPYMMCEADVAHYSIIDPTAYDERLLTYWDLYPEKAPDVIVVDCWYGVLQENATSWIMQYIENDFGYTQMNDGRYVRFYRK